MSKLVDLDMLIVDFPGGISHNMQTSEVQDKTHPGPSTETNTATWQTQPPATRSKRSLRSGTTKPDTTTMTDTAMTLPMQVPAKRSRKSVKSETSYTTSKKSKQSLKSRSVEKVVSHELLAKSLDSVKALLSRNVESELIVATSVKMVNKTTSIGLLAKGVRSTRRSSKAIRPDKLDPDTVLKIARELIRKKGYSLLRILPNRRKPNRKRTSRK